jgi:glycine oxidase
METKLRARVAVAGAGAIGSAVALTLARAGFTVTLFDPNALATMRPAWRPACWRPWPRRCSTPSRPRTWPCCAAPATCGRPSPKGLDLAILRDGLRVEGEETWLATIAARFEALGAPFQRRRTPWSTPRTGGSRLAPP